MSQWVLFKLYSSDVAVSVERRVLINMDRVERIYEHPSAAYFEFFTADGRAEKVCCTADEILLITTAQVLAP